MRKRGAAGRLPDRPRKLAGSYAKGPDWVNDGYARIYPNESKSTMMNGPAAQDLRGRGTRYSETSEECLETKLTTP